MKPITITPIIINGRVDVNNTIELFISTLNYHIEQDNIQETLFKKTVDETLKQFHGTPISLSFVVNVTLHKLYVPHEKFQQTKKQLLNYIRSHATYKNVAACTKVPKQSALYLITNRGITLL